MQVLRLLKAWVHVTNTSSSHWLLKVKRLQNVCQVFPRDSSQENIWWRFRLNLRGIGHDRSWCEVKCKCQQLSKLKCYLLLGTILLVLIGLIPNWIPHPQNSLFILKWTTRMENCHFATSQHETWAIITSESHPYPIPSPFPSPPPPLPDPFLTVFLNCHHSVVQTSLISISLSVMLFAILFCWKLYFEFLQYTKLCPAELQLSWWSS